MGAPELRDGYRDGLKGGECITCGHSHCKGRPFAGPCPERVERPRKASEPSEWAMEEARKVLATERGEMNYALHRVATALDAAVERGRREALARVYRQSDHMGEVTDAGGWLEIHMPTGLWVEAEKAASIRARGDAKPGEPVGKGGGT